MATRREFLKSSVAAVATFPSVSVVGANDRVRLGLIGCGSRGLQVSRYFARSSDCEIAVACDVARSRLDQTLKELADLGARPEATGDYRRVLERADVDAVLVATPDHWHGPMTVEACAAGKDVYVEKPVSNAVEPARRMVEAARAHKRVVQVGLQQRSTEHFQEARAILREGILGPITHVVLQYPGSYTMPPEPPQAPPADLDWEMFQGPAPRRPYTPGRQRGWRSYYDYGGGLVTDWGIHLVDVAHWFLDADTKTPLATSASAQYVNVRDPERQQVPDAFVVSWQYETFVMSFTNAVMPGTDFPNWGTYFFGPRGCLLVSRAGYELRANPPRRRPGGPEPPPPIEGRSRRIPQDQQNGPDTAAHVRNFLDCVKSRQRPTTDIEIGFNSTLPCLLAIDAIRALTA